MRDHLILYVNGDRHRVEGETAFLTLTEFLRRNLRLCGTKVVCSEGDCGACSVLVGSLDGNALRYAVLDACITFLHQLDLCHVVTVEGLTAGGGLHPVQRTMIDHYGSQCGFCTPGFVTTLAGAFEDSAARADSSGDAALGDATARRALTGNLCRCTGYWQILEACAAVPMADHCQTSANFSLVAATCTNGTLNIAITRIATLAHIFHRSAKIWNFATKGIFSFNMGHVNFLTTSVLPLLHL